MSQGGHVAAAPIAPYRIRPSVVRDGLRGTVRYRKRPCGVREAHLSAGAARGGGSSAGCHVERMTGASGSRWRIVMAQVRRMPMRARWQQSRCDTKPDSSGGGQVPDNEQNNDLSCRVLRFFVKLRASIQGTCKNRLIS